MFGLRKKNYIKKDSKSIFVGINVTILKDGDYYIFYCPALNLSSYATNEDQAKLRFEKELKIFLSETTEKDTLDKYLLQHGWTLRKKPKPIYVPPETEDRLNMGQITISSFLEQIAIPI